MGGQHDRLSFREKEGRLVLIYQSAYFYSLTHLFNFYFATSIRSPSISIVPSISSTELSVLNFVHSPLLLRMYVLLSSITMAREPTEHDLKPFLVEGFLFVGSSDRSATVSQMNLE